MNFLSANFAAMLWFVAGLILILVEFLMPGLIIIFFRCRCLGCERSGIFQMDHDHSAVNVRSGRNYRDSHECHFQNR